MVIFVEQGKQKQPDFPVRNASSKRTPKSKCKIGHCPQAINKNILGQVHNKFPFAIFRGSGIEGFPNSLDRLLLRAFP
jgi:hypothetical protein